MTQDAGLDLNDRADLCRRLLTMQDPPYHHVVWLCYEEAQVQLQSLGFGPVTFYSGKSLTEAVTTGSDLYQHVENQDGSHGFKLVPLPAELPTSDDQGQWSWPDVDNWVAVRVDFGHGHLTDPVTAAIQQVDMIVRLTAFGKGGTSWRRLQGYHHVSDGLSGSSSSFRSDVDPLTRFVTDETDFALGRLSIKLAPHLPVTDSHLQELLDAAALLDRHYEDLDSTSIVDSVRVVERVAGLVPRLWSQHLTDTFAIEWARRQIVLVINDGMAAAEHAEERRNLPNNLYSWVNGDKRIDQAVAVNSIPGLLTDIPAHRPTARLLREVAARAATPSDLEDWVSDLVAVYDRLVKRLVRCRNSLAHGGPLSDATSRTVVSFAWNQARHTINVALWAVASGSTSPQAHRDHHQRHKQWRDKLQQVSTMTDAFG
jgi:hypothetical protein